MITFRKNPFSAQEELIERVEGETLNKTVDRCLLLQGYGDDQLVRESFQVLMNGLIVDRELWPFTSIKESDSVLIGPKLERGDGAQIFKQIAIVVVSIVASVFLSPAVGGGIYGALAVAGATIAATLVMNGLIPPPSMAGLGGGDSNGYEDSQTYVTTSQSNSPKKYGFVPRVYGTHRMFPNVAANAYTEIETDPDTGELAQYFYCIYDVGFGPMEINNVMIGNTNIDAYAEASYRLVDFNAPLNDEGPWDEALNQGPNGTRVRDFLHYKGDNETDGTTFSFVGNEVDGASPSEYQVIRNASASVDDTDQEIIIDLVAPNGLIAFNSTGKKLERTVKFDIQFSKVGEDVWRPYNDLRYVYDFTTSGGKQADELSSYVTLRPFELPANSSQYRQLSFYSTGTSYFRDEHYTYGIAKGMPWIDVIASTANTGDALYKGGQLIGIIQSISSSPISGYVRCNLRDPVPFNIPIYRVRFTSNSTTYWIIEDVKKEKIVTRKTTSAGVAIMAAARTTPTYATFSFKPKEKAQYKVKISRIISSSKSSYQIQDSVNLYSLRTRFNRTAIKTDKRHVFLELKIKATNQLNGAIQNLSVIASSVLNTWDGTNWVKKPSNNPAWVLVDLLSGEINKKALPLSRLHLPSIKEWADFCDEVPADPPDFNSEGTPRFESNFVLDFETTLQAMVNTLTSASQASLSIVDGKYGVLVDKLRTIPVQVFTPRNSSNFSSKRGYSDTPHAIKVKYIDSSNNWVSSEVVIYDDGYSDETATEIDELPTFGCTNYYQAWRFGRYMMAQAKLRRETITITVDFENLVCTRGDFVKFTSDVMRVGGTPARVKTVVGNRITIDDGLETTANPYGYTFRNNTGIRTSTLTVISPDTFDLGGDLPNPGDLIIVGEVGKISLDCIVKSIVPDSNLTATVTLVEKADPLYSVESTGVVPPYDPNLNTALTDENATPGPVVGLILEENTYRVTSNDYEYYMKLDWDAPNGSTYELFEIYVDSGRGFDLWDTTTETFYEYVVNNADIGTLHRFKVLAVSANGRKLNLIEAPEVQGTPTEKISPPSDVSSLFIDITNEVLTLNWSAIPDLDVREYVIRYSPVIEGSSWEVSVILAKVDRNTTVTSTQGRTGKYFIKAIDFNGNESTNAAAALTSIPNLFDLNIIETLDDFPALNGTGDRVVKQDGTVSLEVEVPGTPDTLQYFSEGYYYYNELLDLGEIYTVRLQSLIQAGGFKVGDLMSSWDTLADVAIMNNSYFAEWDVKTQYRATNSLNVMAQWGAMSDIDPISEGDQDQFTEWRDFTIGDATGRIFQFRLKLISNNPTVTPRVFIGKIKADMPDRLESYTNLVVPVDGLDIVYDVAFKGPGTTPNIQVTQDGYVAGDRVEITDRTLEGFKITVYDENGDSVERQVDISVKGYGRRALSSI